MTTKKITTTTTSKKRPLKKVATKQPKKQIVEKVVIEQPQIEEEQTDNPAWDDDDDEENKQPLVNNNNNENKEEEEEEESRIVKKAKTEPTLLGNDNEAWVDEEDTNGMKFRNRNLLTVTPEWAKIKEKENQEEDEEETKLFNSSKQLINLDSIKFFQDKCQNVLRGQVTGLTYSPDGNVIFMADAKGTFRVYAGVVELTKKFKPLYESKFVDFPIANIYFISKTREVLITGVDREYYYTFEVLNEKITKRPLRVGKNYLKKSAMSEDYFSISDSTGRVMMISNLSKTIVNEFRMPSAEISAMNYSADGKILFVASQGNIYCFSVDKMSIIHKFKDFGNFGSNSITTIACSPNGNYFVTGSESGIVNSYRYQDCLEQIQPKPLRSITSILYPITTLQFSDDSNLLLAASQYDNKSSKIVQYPSHKMHRQFSAFAKVSSSCFSPNSQRIIIGEDAGNLIFYRAKFFDDNNKKIKSKKNTKNNKNNNNNNNTKSVKRK